MLSLIKYIGLISLPFAYVYILAKHGPSIYAFLNN